METAFDRTSLEAARDNLARLFEKFAAATAVPMTLISEVVSDDKAFVSRYGKTSFSFATYDRVAGRFSAIWPAGTDWPAGVPRPEPEIVPIDLLAKLTARLERQASPSVPALPGNASWPADIPAPRRSTPETTEARNG